MRTSEKRGTDARAEAKPTSLNQNVCGYPAVHPLVLKSEFESMFVNWHCVYMWIYIAGMLHFTFVFV
jgi:hypothetical protein